MWLLIAEVLCVALIVGGIYLVSLPAALIVAGVLGVLICERAVRPEPKKVDQ